MWGKSKANNQHCPTCGHYMVAPGATPDKKVWKADANTQRFERKGDGYRQTWPLPVPAHVRSKSATRARLEQGLAVGICLSACVLPFSPAHAIGTLLAFSSGTYVLSVALGKENQEALFKLLDRNRDGKLNVKDIDHAVNAVLDKVLEPDEERPHVPQSTTDRVEYGFALDRRMPDGAIHRAVLLPDYPRYVTKEKLKQCARLYFELDGNENFSKRKCGAPFGDDLSQVQEELERLGYIVKDGGAANSPRMWTPDGERWLEKWLD